MLDDYDLDLPEDEEPTGDGDGEGGSNRTFIMVAGGLGALMLIALIFMAIYAFFIAPGRNDAENIAAQTAQAQQEQINQQLTEAAQAAFTPTVTQTSVPTGTPTRTLVPSATLPVATEVLALATATTEGGPTADPRTATVQALLTQAAVAQTQAAGSLLTVTPTPTITGALPETGFIDDIGATGLLAMTALLVLVIFMARRLREANA